MDQFGAEALFCVAGHNNRFAPGCSLSVMKLVITLLAAIGMAVSSAALYEHYNLGSAPCNINDRWDCGAVNHSPYADVRGIPVALMGVVGYALIGVLAWTGPAPLLLLVSSVAMGIALELTALEASVLNVWCLYCVASQADITVITLLSFIQAMRRRRSLPRPQAAAESQ